MTTQHTCRRGRIDLDGWTFLDDATVAVTDDDTVVLAVHRWTDHGGRETGPLAVVDVEGDLDIDTVLVLRHALDQALRSPGPVCCDLTRATFFGAAAAGLVLTTHQRAAGSGQSFFLRGVRGLAELVLGVVDPHRLLPRS